MLRGIAPPARTKVTSVDVAKRAGVSQATVSLVLSGKAPGRISEATAELVRAAARDLGYRPNVAARALRSGTSSAVGLVVRDVTHPFFSLTLRGAQRAAREAGYVVVLVDDATQETTRSVEALRHGAIDGFLFFAADPPAQLRTAGSTPAVVIEATPARFPHVRLDVEQGMRTALEHLAELGHRRIGYLMADVASETFERRRAVWQEHLRQSDVDPGAMPVARSRFHAAAAIDAGRELLARRGDATAVVCDDDVLASGLVVAAREAGVAVPGELSVVGFDDLDHALLVDPPLTTVRVDGEALGAAGFELLHARLQDRRPRSRVLGGLELVIRGSTGPAR